MTQFHWDTHNPTFDWTTVTTNTYADVAQQGSRNIADVTDTFDDLDVFRASGGKLLTFVGANDQLIMPQGVLHYYRQMAQRYGGPHDDDFSGVQKFYRLFRAPGVGHCGGGAGPQPQGLFDALVNWVENKVPPKTITAHGHHRRRGHAHAAAVPVPADRHLQGQRQHRRRGQLHLRRQPRNARGGVRQRAGEVQARGQWPARLPRRRHLARRVPRAAGTANGDKDD